MPSQGSYTPYETLRLCQLICQYGDDQEAFDTISKELGESDLVRECDTYDAERLTVDALQELYTNLTRLEKGASPRVNGDAASDAPASRKRKASTSPQPNGVDSEGQLQALVDKLYAKFREQIISEIRRDEEEYQRLQQEIAELEKAESVDNGSPAPVTAQQQAPHGQSSTGQSSINPERQPAVAPTPGPLSAQPTPPPGFAPHPPTMTSHTQQQQIGAPYGMHAPSPVPGRPSGPPPPAHAQVGYPPPPMDRQQSPYQQPYPPYPQTAPIQYQPLPQGWQSPAHSPYPQPHSAFSTPGQFVARGSIQRTPGSSTPWKRRSVPPPNSQRPPSPVRPERSISPVSDTESSDKPRRASTKPAQKAATPKREGPPPRRGRPPGTAASRRSQSVASQVSEAPVGDVERKAIPVKIEAPNTPQPSNIEVEQRSSGRRGNLRNSVSLTAAQSESLRPATNKRKRSATVQESESPPTDRQAHKAASYSDDPSLVLVSKSFAKTAQLVLNEINSHKLGGVFAKPLTERDAPGYKDLILRPQDLKSIKTAVSKGSRAAVAAIEALDLPEDENNDNITDSRDAEGQRAVDNGFYLIKKSDDLEPPKGIVNAAQLEMELMRMFANAIMFNPLPRTERGFGYNLRLRKRGGDISHRDRDRDHIPESQLAGGKAEEDEDDPDQEDSEPSEDLDAAEYTGIIADAREMFEDVRKQVEAWRELENERRGVEHNSATGGGGSFKQDHLRQGSVSSIPGGGDEHSGVGTSSSTPVASKEKEVPTPVEEGRGTLRKRRKLAANAGD
ncbi:uncharacterized protein AB675_6891 [Cyphellophora attinorum]|uniref:Bromo domain-containing protein n=1 Tax=Cyphellophora attinorum TaxID=1664694 RepID=A0A0N1HUV4_9EURO|nr:uncharacterized protein AB675_6891 [Phialophora attinorum]KPI43300.1 hypothetical protein AB675_6891 [Phialophora attinorum]